MPKGKGKILFSLAAGLAVYMALAVFADLPKIGQALAAFRWQFIPAILGLTLLNYLLRFVKWHYYLHQIGVRTISSRDSLLVFFSGLSMVVTPGKVGEWLKCYLLKQTAGTPISASAPILIAERLTDGLAMLGLASVGLLIYGYGWQVLSVVLLVALVLVALIQSRPLAYRAISLGEKLPFVSRKAHHLYVAYDSAYALLKLRNLTIAIAIGLVSWAGESVAFWFVLVGLGLDPSATLLLQATFILSVSTIVGSVSMLPGGLAVAEGSITTLLLLLGVTAEPWVAAAATLLIRLCTLWFGVAVGICALFLSTRGAAPASDGNLPSLAERELDIAR
ncbi:MAG: flippase-like domain-containing protein [Chloroflexi bacterium]|nr:flippase-like domain-containing protein [Chloroflexota bacterium]